MEISDENFITDLFPDSDGNDRWNWRWFVTSDMRIKRLKMVQIQMKRAL